MTDTANNLFIVAKTEYTSRLKDILEEGIELQFQKIFKEDPNLRRFQENLCKIPGWNQEIIDQMYKGILSQKKISGDFVDKLIEAVFISNIKILSVVKLKDTAQNVNVTIPDTKNFIHKIIIEVARELYRNPYLIESRENFVSKSQRLANSMQISDIISNSIEKIVRLQIPMEEILDAYLQTNQPKEQPEMEVDEPELQEADPEPSDMEIDEPTEDHSSKETIEREFMEPPVDTPTDTNIKVPLSVKSDTSERDMDFFSEEE